MTLASWPQPTGIRTRATEGQYGGVRALANRALCGDVTAGPYLFLLFAGVNVACAKEPAQWGVAEATTEAEGC